MNADNGTHSVEGRYFVVWPFRDSGHQELIDLIDEDWIVEKKAQIADSLDRLKKTSPLSAQGLGRRSGLDSHLLLREVADELTINHQFPGWTPHWDVVGAAVAEVERLPGFPRNSFRSRIRNSHACRGAMFELLIAAGYSRASWNITWTDTDAYRAGEFRAQSRKWTIFVECKTKEESTERTEQMKTIQR